MAKKVDLRAAIPLIEAEVRITFTQADAAPVVGTLADICLHREGGLVTLIEDTAIWSRRTFNADDIARIDPFSRDLHVLAGGQRRLQD